MTSEVYLIGIAGTSGSGKSYLARHLADRVEAEVIELDRYYRDLSHLSLEQREGTNFDAPGALEHELLIEQIARLRNREVVRLPLYDFATHMRVKKTEAFRPSNIVIVEGLFTLHWPGLRELLSTKVYVDLDDDTCLHRRKSRDVRERGRTEESVLAQYEATVAPMALRYVRPTRAYADVVVGGEEPVEQGVARIVEHCRQRMAQQRVSRRGVR
jgi:uridine kinase